MKTIPSSSIQHGSLLSQSETGIVHFFHGERKSSEFLFRSLFRIAPDDANYLQLVGAPGYLHVYVGTLGHSLYLEFHEHDHIGLTGTCLIGRRNGEICLLNEGCRLLSPNTHQRGIGLQWFLRQKNACCALNVKKILTFAARSPLSSGYYALPRYGFNAKLPSQIRTILPSEFSKCQTLHDLFHNRSGVDWWKQNGCSLRVVFDMASESNSEKTLDAYLAECNDFTSQRGKKQPLF